LYSVTIKLSENVQVDGVFFHRRGTWGGGEVLNTATPQKKINEHRITARKVNETPSPQLVFLPP